MSQTACWRCRGLLRVADAAYCPHCGAAQRQGAVADSTAVSSSVAALANESIASDWKTRIEQVSARPGPGLSWLWVLVFPLSPLTYPFLLMQANRRLRRHVRQHLSAPALQTPRATQTLEGRAIIDKLAGSAGRLTSGGMFSLLLSLLLLLICGHFLFIVPAQAPQPIDYGRAMEAVLEAGRTPAYVYFNSQDDYDSFWKHYPTWKYDDIQILTGNYRRGYDRRDAASPTSDLPTYDHDARRMSPSQHPPYEYVRNKSGYEQYHRISGLTLYWEETESAGVLFWVSASLLYLVYVVSGLIFWSRFARHRQAEVLAAAYAAGDPGFHDRLLPMIRQRNRALMWLVIPLSAIGLHLILFPVLSTRMFARHAAWEERAGIRSALA